MGQRLNRGILSGATGLRHLLPGIIGHRQNPLFTGIGPWLGEGGSLALGRLFGKFPQDHPSPVRLLLHPTLPQRQTCPAPVPTTASPTTQMRYLAATLAAATLFLASCAEKKPALHLYTWDDYLNPALVTKFEEEFDCRVVIDIFDSNEAMLARLKAGATGYDVLVPSSYMVKILAREGLIQELDHSKLPNLSHVDPEYLENLAFDKEMEWSVPYMLAPTGIAYVSDRVEDVTPSWRVFERADLRGRMTLLNDSRETIGAALRTLGFSLNSTDPDEIDQARDLVIQWKANIAKFESDQYNSGLASGEFFVSQRGDQFRPPSRGHLGLLR